MKTKHHVQITIESGELVDVFMPYCDVEHLWNCHETKDHFATDDFSIDMTKVIMIEDLGEV